MDAKQSQSKLQEDNIKDSCKAMAITNHFDLIFFSVQVQIHVTQYPLSLLFVEINKPHKV